MEETSEMSPAAPQHDEVKEKSKDKKGDWEGETREEGWKSREGGVLEGTKKLFPRE